MTPADDDDLDGDAQFQGVRDLFRYAREQGFDEDPSPRVDAILMAAARQHAPEQVGSFERVRRWLVASMMRPAVLGATMVAIVGASAGVLYLRSGGVAEPTVGRTQGSTPPAVTTQAPEHRALEDLPLQGAAAGSGSGSVMRTETPEEIAAQFRAIQEKESQQTTDDPRPRPRGGGGGGGGSGSAIDGFAGGNEDRGGGSGSDVASGEGRSLDYRPDGRDTATVVTTGPGGGKGGIGNVGVATHIEATGQEKSPPPPPDVGIGGSGGDDDETAAITNSPVTTDKIDQAESEKAKKAAANRAQAENLLRQARTAARKKDCSTVKVMAKRAKQLDAAYYKDSFTRDTAVKNCL